MFLCVNGAHSIKVFESLFYMAHLTFDKKLLLKKQKQGSETNQQQKKKHKKNLLPFRTSLVSVSNLFRRDSCRQPQTPSSPLWLSQSAEVNRSVLRSEHQR